MVYSNQKGIILHPTLIRLANLSLAKVAQRAHYFLCSLRASKLTPKQSLVLSKMRADNAMAADPFRASTLWADVAKIFDREFHQKGVGDVESRYFNLRFSGFAPGDQRLHGYLVYIYFQKLRERDKYGLLRKISTNLPVQPGLAYHIDGCTVSLDLLFSIDEFYSLIEIRPDLMMTQSAIIADLGAGWGRLGFVLKKANPDITYVVFDLPEVLLISSTYLPTVLPGHAFQSYEQSRRLQTLERETLIKGKMWFLGSQDMTRIQDGALDIVVNIGSFQEMTANQVAQYLKIMDKKIVTGGGVYLKQLWSGKTHGHRHGEIGGYNDYLFPANWEQLFLRSVCWSQDFFETGFRVR